MSQDIQIEIESPSQVLADMALAKQAGDTLLKHYPGYLWSVEVKRGVINVRNLNLSGRWGFVLKLSDVYSATQLDKMLMRAGGEILERYRLSRERMGAERAVSKLLALPTDFTGNLAFDK